MILASPLEVNMREKFTLNIDENNNNIVNLRGLRHFMLRDKSSNCSLLSAS